MASSSLGTSVLHACVQDRIFGPLPSSSNREFCTSRAVTCRAFDKRNGRVALNTSPSGSDRAVLTSKLSDTVDLSRESVSRQSVPLITPRRSYRVSLFDALKFWGPAPEKINGRLAMLGFLLGALNEPKTGLPLIEQAKAAPVFVGFLTFIVVWASLIPITKGAKSEAFGAFSPRAEITNGRAAMLGFAVLLALETKAGVAFF